MIEWLRLMISYYNSNINRGLDDSVIKVDDFLLQLLH
jgi:hypothetical protein